jgi:D-aminoacyl-tRNA deacylase
MGSGPRRTKVLKPACVGAAVLTEYVVVISETDPVASRVAERWGTPPAEGPHVEGAAIRRLGPTALLLRRPGRHIHDERLDERLPPELRALNPTLVFPSIHSSERNIPCLTVHPVGNLGPTAEVGGRPRTVDPTDPRRMATTLRRLAAEARALGLSATYEATHHGPELGLPAFFVEIGFASESAPPEGAVDLIARTLVDLVPDDGDRIALGIGGGHYVPHFTELSLRRRWAFGHLISRHALVELDRATARTAFSQTPGAQGVVFARAEDARHPSLEGVGPRLRDAEAPEREASDARGGGRSASGT